MARAPRQNLFIRQRQALNQRFQQQAALGFYGAPAAAPSTDDPVGYANNISGEEDESSAGSVAAVAAGRTANAQRRRSQFPRTVSDEDKRFSRSNIITLPSGVTIPYDASAPQLWLPVSGGQLGGFVYYDVEQLWNEASATGLLRAQRSVGNGVVWLGGAGKWLLRFDGSPTSTAAAVFFVLHDPDPTTVSRWLLEPGNHYTTITTVTAPASVANAALLLGASQHRKEVILQNMDLTIPIKFKLNSTDVSAPLSTVGVNCFRLLENSMPERFLGDDVVRHGITVNSENAGAGAAISAMEIF